MEQITWSYLLFFYSFLWDISHEHVIYKKPMIVYIALKLINVKVMKNLVYFLLVLMFSLMSSLINAQDWEQMDSDINGEHKEDHCGYAVSVNDDGTIVAVGTPEADVSYGTRAGNVIVYKFNAGVWEKIGNPINGSGYIELGSAVSLNSDGTIVAIGIQDYSNANYNCGAVSIYKNNNGTWSQIGSDISGSGVEDHLGKSVGINSDGSIVVMGAPFHDHTSTNQGQVRIFKNFNGSWGQIGYDIYGENEKDEFGTSVSINSDGTIIACGAPNNDANGINSGAVKVYKNINSTWTQMGSDIIGEDRDYFGRSVSLSDDGTVVAVGGNRELGMYNVVRIYKYNGSSWIKIGDDIPHSASIGFSVSLNSDGTIVAAGGPKFGTTSSESGLVRVYKNISNTWTQIGTDIEGSSNYARLGYSVSLSADGSVVVAGAPFYTGAEYYCGRTKIFSNATVTNIKNESKNKQFDMYPNPTSGLVNMDFSTSGIHRVIVSDITGRTLFEKAGKHQHETVDLSNLKKGVYIITIVVDDERYIDKIIKK